LAVNTVNNQPRQLTSEESQYLRRQLQEMRNRINQLLDNLGSVSCSELSDGAADSGRPADSVASTTSVSSASAAAGSFDPLTRQKHSTATGSADAGS